MKRNSSNQDASGETSLKSKEGLISWMTMTNTNFLERNKSQMDSSSTFDKRGVVDARKGTEKQAK